MKKNWLVKNVEQTNSLFFLAGHFQKNPLGDKKKTGF
jgi:hypothetical protein